MRGKKEGRGRREEKRGKRREEERGRREEERGRREDFHIMDYFVTSFKGCESQETLDQRKSMPNKNRFCLSE